MNDFNVLLAAATNGTPSGSLFDALFARYIAPQESWRELESPLPITILTAGEDLIDYRIYGNTVGGESVGERTENLFDKNSTNVQLGCSMSIDGDIFPSQYFDLYTISILPNTNYYLYGQPNSSKSDYHYFCDINGNLLVPIKVSYSQNPQLLSSPTGAAFLKTSILRSARNRIMILKSSTVPTSYIPFGYKLPMVATNGTTTTTTPIYIGSDPLAEDEYVDFGEQKIYRMEGGTLTPTDPPVPIPALPTIEGETIIDYNPSTTPAVEPEKMHIKYKPQ